MFRFTIYFLVTIAVVAHAIVADKTKMSPILPIFKLIRFSRVPVVTKSPDKIKNKIPIFSGINNGYTDQLKALGAAMAASGAVALYHIEKLTPEADLVEKKDLETINVDQNDIDEMYDSDKSDVQVLRLKMVKELIVELE